MLAHHDISGTAFVVNVSRAKREDLCLDIYARLWITPEARTLWEELSRDVYPFDDVSSSLRNRFYLERQRVFAAKNARPVSLNMAAGFSMYPFLLGPEWRCVETDFLHIVTAKQRQTDVWMAEGRLPRRDVTWFGANLGRTDDLEALAQALPGWIDGRPTFAMMEGLTYYLPRPALDRLFGLYAAHLPAGSLVAFEHWPPNAAAYPVFVRLNAYLKDRFGWTAPDYDLFDQEYVAGIPGFEVVETTDIAAVERRWSEGRVLQDRTSRLPICFSVLRKD